MGVSCTFVGHLARFGTVGGDVSGTQDIGSCIFSETLHGGTWGRMRSRHRISAQSEVIWRVNPCFKKTVKVWRLPTEFHVGMAVDVMLGLGSNFVWEGFQDRGHPLKLSHDLHT